MLLLSCVCTLMCAFCVNSSLCQTSWKGLRITRHHFQNWRLNVCMGERGLSSSFWTALLFFFPIRCKSPLWAVLINKIAFSLAADDFMSEEKGEAVSNLGRNCHHQFQLGGKKTKQILINTKWVIDEQCGRMCWGELWSCRLGMVGCLTRTQRTCKTIL